jgi:phosphoribosylformimino-5-aminoimidazole carboxamide ribotide isomerase
VLVFPAIDLRGGCCVRLRQGDFTQETIFATDPVQAARQWLEEGATFLHLVDLDGARLGYPVNGPIIQAIVAATGVSCQVGGGLRTEADIQLLLSWGATRVILGTRALKDPTWLKEICHRFPNRIVLGLDARDGQVATDGWQEITTCPALDLVHLCSGWPLAAVVYTDIRRDGMMAGPNLETLAEVAGVARVPVIASGGITTLEDVRRLVPLGLAGCIIGRALYEGRIRLGDAIAAAKQ